MREPIRALQPPSEPVMSDVETNCHDCGVVMRLSSAGVHALGVMNAMLKARGEATIAVRDVAFCPSCYTSRRFEGERERAQEYKRMRDLADGIRRSGRSLGIARLRSEVKSPSFDQVAFAYAHLLGVGRTIPELEVQEIIGIGGDFATLIRGAIENAGRLTNRRRNLEEDLT